MCLAADRLEDPVHERIGAYGAAELLDINPSTLRSRIQKLGIARPEYAS